MLVVNLSKNQKKNIRRQVRRQVIDANWHLYKILFYSWTLYWTPTDIWYNHSASIASCDQKITQCTSQRPDACTEMSNQDANLASDAYRCDWKIVPSPDMDTNVFGTVKSGLNPFLSDGKNVSGNQMFDSTSWPTSIFAPPWLERDWNASRSSRQDWRR